MFDLLLLTIVTSFMLAKTYQLTVRGQLSSTLVAGLFVYHTLFSVIYYFLAKTMPADANMYFRVGSEMAASMHYNAEFKPGTAFILWIVESLLGWFDLSKVTFFILFGFAGFLGLMYVLLSFRPFMTSSTMRLYQLVLFLPGVSFWTSSLGKDSLIFLPICYLMYAFSRPNLPMPKILLALVLIFLIRPHVGLVITLCMGLTLLFSGKQISTAVKALSVAALGAASVVLLPLVASFVGLDDLSLQGVSEKIEGQAGHNQAGGGAVNLNQMSLPAQIFAYLFRPLFFDAKGLLGLVVSVENLIYLAMFGYMCRGQFVTFVRQHTSFIVMFSVLYFLAMTLMMATTTANSGIAIRQKLMYFPFFLYLFMWFASWMESTKTIKTTIKEA